MNIYLCPQRFQYVFTIIIFYLVAIQDLFLSNKSVEKQYDGLIVPLQKNSVSSQHFCDH